MCPVLHTCEEEKEEEEEEKEEKERAERNAGKTTGRIALSKIKISFGQNRASAIEILSEGVIVSRRGIPETR